MTADASSSPPELAREHRLVLELCKRDGAYDRPRLHQAVRAPMDWNRVFLSSMWHKTLFLVYEALKRTELLDVALVEGNLPLLLLNHWKQLYAVNGIRNRVQLRELRAVVAALDEAGVRVAVAKGGPALFGRAYTPTERKCYDVDLLAEKKDVAAVQAAFARAGYRLAEYHHSTGAFRDIPREEIRKWLLHTRGLPNFVKPVDCEVMDYVIVQVQFKVGSTAGGAKAISAEPLLDRRIEYDGLPAVCNEDLLLQLALHLYRETTEESFAEWNMSYNLIKLCDLDRFAAYAHARGGLDAFADRARELGLAEPARHAFALLQAVFPSEPARAAAAALGGADVPAIEPGPVLEKVFRIGESLHAPTSAWDALMAPKTT